MIDQDELCGGDSLVADDEKLLNVERAMNDLQVTEAKLAGIDAKVNEKIAEIRDKVAPDVAALEAKAMTLRNTLTEFALREKSNVSFFPDGKKTLDLRAGSIQVNAGKPKISVLPGYDEKTVILKIHNAGLATDLIRNPEPELDKTAVMDMVDRKELTPAILTSLGLEKKQDETVIIKLNTADKIKTPKTKGAKAVPA